MIKLVLFWGVLNLSRIYNTLIIPMYRNKTIRWLLKSIGRRYAILMSAGRKKGLMKVRYHFSHIVCLCLDDVLKMLAIPHASVLILCLIFWDCREEFMFEKDKVTDLH